MYIGTPDPQQFEKYETVPVYRMEKVLTHAYLASFLRGTDGLCDLRKVI